jgi:PKD repeat protein
MNIRIQNTLLALSIVLSAGSQTFKTSQTPPEAGSMDRKVPTQRTCGTAVPSAEWDAAFNKQVEAFKERMLSGKTLAASYTIPVIVHIVHGGQSPGTYPNVTFAQIKSQIDVLNADFSGTGFNVGNLASTAFSAVGAADCEITFCLATKNALGQTLPEPGVERINYVDRGWANPASFSNMASFMSFVDATVKPETIWDPTYFLNIWISDTHSSNTILGYATFPGGALLSGLGPVGSATTDGIYCWTGCFGNQGTVFAPYNLGRTASHEIGHWLGLRHIGGDGDGNPSGSCAATDFCNDTPPQKGGENGGSFGQNYGQPSYPLFATGSNSCAEAPNGCMFMNFMDYCDDPAAYMFTPDQKSRMHTAMNTGYYRSQLSASSASQCNNPASAPVAKYSLPATACNTLGIVNASDNISTGNPIPTYSWTTSPSAGVTYSPNSTHETPGINFPSAGVYTVTCIATNSLGSNSSEKTITIEACDVGVNKHSVLSSHIALFPNPAKGFINVVTNLPSAQQLEISVHNSLGQEIRRSTHPSVTNSLLNIDLTSFSQGLYFVIISNGTEKTMRRIVVQN